MCLRTGGVKLLDFGIAKAFGEASAEHTEQGLFKGKLAYVAPERIKNAAARRARRSVRAGRRAVGDAGRAAAVPRQERARDADQRARDEGAAAVVASARTSRASLDAIVLRALERDPTALPDGPGDGRRSRGGAARDQASTARMLPDLLREAVRVRRDSSQETMSSVTPELLATLTERHGDGHRNRRSRPRAPARHRCSRHRDASGRAGGWSLIAGGAAAARGWRSAVARWRCAGAAPLAITGASRIPPAARRTPVAPAPSRRAAARCRRRRRWSPSRRAAPEAGAATGEDDASAASREPARKRAQRPHRHGRARSGRAGSVDRSIRRSRAGGAR